MNRNSWNFPYTADVLHKAASEKHEFHTQRYEWWGRKKLEVIEKIKAEGLEIDESVAEEVGKFYNTGRSTTVNVRDDLLRDLQECVGKVKEHRSKFNEYEAWMQVLSSQGQASFNLNQDDWLFFFGK